MSSTTPAKRSRNGKKKKTDEPVKGRVDFRLPFKDGNDLKEKVTENTVFYEAANLDALAYVYSHWSDLGLSNEPNPRFGEDHDEFIAPREALRRYLDAAKNGYVEVYYHQGKGNGPVEGRWFAEGAISLQGLPRPVRGVGARGLYADLDIVNCNPSLGVALCTQEKVACPALKELRDNRKACVEKLGGSFADAKRTYLAVMNGGTRDASYVPNDTAHFRAFGKEMATIRQQFAERAPGRLKAVARRRQQKGKFGNHDSALLSMIMSEVENQVLHVIWEYFNNPKTCVLCFDGIMLRCAECGLLTAEGEVIKSEVEQVEQHIAARLGLDMKLKVKTFDASIAIPENVQGEYKRYLQSEEHLTRAIVYPECFIESITDHVTPAEHYVRRFKRNTVRNMLVEPKKFALCMFDPATCLWISRDEGSFRSAVRWCLQHTIRDDYEALFQRWKRHVLREHTAGTDGLTHKEVDKMIAHRLTCTRQLRNTHFANAVYEVVVDLLTNDHSIRRNIQFNINPLANETFQFKNGAYNLRTGELVKRTREMRITTTLEYDWKEEDVKADKVAEVEDFIETILPNKTIRDGWYAWKGYMLTGIIEDDKFVLNIGETASNGKSTLCQMFGKAFDLYSMQIDAAVFNSGGSGANDSLYNKTFGAMLDKPIRQAWADEWDAEEGNFELVKKASSGVTQPVAIMYGNLVQMQKCYKIEICTNKRISASDASNGSLRRGLVIPYETKFVETEAEKQKLEGTIEHVHVKDSKVLDKFEKNEYRLALFSILAKHAKNFFENGLSALKNFNEGFRELIRESDPWEEFFDHVVIDKTKKTSKNDMMKLANETFGEGALKTNTLRRKLKEHGIAYDSQLYVKPYKGYFLGCTLR